MKKWTIVMVMFLLLTTYGLLMSEISFDGSSFPSSEPNKSRAAKDVQLNFTYLDHDAVSFGSTAFRTWDHNITIFIEAFPNVTSCDWDPETIDDADIIIQNHHGHSSHYDADECATVALNTGAYVVGNTALKNDMTDRGVPESQIVEISPSLGGKDSATISSLGVKIHSYGMIHTMMTSTQVDTFLIEMPNGMKWYHGTCSSESATMNYMSNYPELKGLDVMICDTDMNFGTLNNQYYPETLIKDHDFNYGSTPIPATVYESYPTVSTRLFHNQTYKYVRPEYVPSIENGDVDKNEGLVDTEFDFTVTYKYRLDKAPTTAKIVIDSHAYDMTTTGSGFRTGVVYHHRTNLSEGPHDYHFEFTADGMDLRYPSEGELEGPVINYIPLLDSNDVDPESGDDDLEYTFSVIYIDGDGEIPDDHYVIIDGEKESMMREGSDYINGVMYSYTGRLSSDDHEYHFEFSDGNYEVRFPEEGEFHGPSVSRANYPPTISGGNVDPLRGNRLDDFIFSVTYRDSHGDMPHKSILVLDGNVYNLSSEGMNFKTGVVYSIKLELGLGTHSFYFEFEEGPFTIRFPEGDNDIEGPVVENLKPVVSIDRPVEMEEFSTTERIILNASSSNDPEDDDLTFSWRSNLDGDLGEGKELEVFLSEGQHTITLEIDDGFGGTAMDSVIINVIHYMPVISIDPKILPSSPEEGSHYKLAVEITNTGNLHCDDLQVMFLLDGEMMFNNTIDRIEANDRTTLKYGLDAIAGDHIFEVRAGKDIVETLEFSIDERLPPVADAGEDKNGKVGDLITFDGTDSNSIGFIENYTWIINGNEYYGSIVQFKFEQSGTYNITLRVEDEIGKSTEDTIKVIITEPPQPGGDDRIEDTSGSGVVLYVILAAGLLVFIVIFAAGFIVLAKKKKETVLQSTAREIPVIPPIQKSNDTGNSHQIKERMDEEKGKN